ncbi:hypothetical protein RKD19_003947 [Streptomyces canus]
MPAVAEESRTGGELDGGRGGGGPEAGGSAVGGERYGGQDHLEAGEPGVDGDREAGDRRGKRGHGCPAAGRLPLTARLRITSCRFPDPFGSAAYT